MNHYVLLGDSIFDNAPYVSDGKDVRAHLAKALARRAVDHRVTLLAVDGALCADVEIQLRHLPHDADRLFLSVGGNDLLSEIDLLEARAGTVAEGLSKLARMLEQVVARYRRAVQACIRTGQPLGLCAVYGGCFPDQRLQACVDLVVALFHDRVHQIAAEHQLPVIDLRQICREEADYVQCIEPSDTGGQKIAQALASLIEARCW